MSRRTRDSIRRWPRWIALGAIACALSLPATETLLGRAKPLTASDLDRFIQEKRYAELRRNLSSVRLDRVESAYFRGILYDREGRAKKAIALLSPVLPLLRKTSLHRAFIALDALGSDYFMAGQYAESVRAYTDLLDHFTQQLGPAQERLFRDNRNTFVLLGRASPQTLSGRRSFRVALRRDPFGDLDVPVVAAGATHWWILDTGANLSTVTLTTAKEIGAAVSKGHASTQGSTGFEAPVSTTVIPELRVGTAVIRNVPALVLDDKYLNMQVGKDRHAQISGILGYPALAALGSLTVSRNVLSVRPKSPSSAFSCPLWVEELDPLLQLTVSGRRVLFELDTGDDGAELGRRFVREFPSVFAGLKLNTFGIEGVGGPLKLRGYVVPELPVQIGSRPAVLAHIRALTSTLGEYPVDELYGNLGQSFLRQFESYTIDFRRMRFSVNGTAEPDAPQAEKQTVH